MSQKEIISEIKDRNAFLHLLQLNPGLIVIKLGAEWCGPCKQIANVVHAFFASSPSDVVCGDIDIDVSFDFYAYLKSKKMVNGVPVLLCYKKGNTNFIPDDSVTGADPAALNSFFKRCGNHLLNVQKQYPLTASQNKKPIIPQTLSKSI
jgi:thioredoxin-like negative regulator of GroEL